MDDSEQRDAIKGMHHEATLDHKHVAATTIISRKPHSPHCHEFVIEGLDALLRRKLRSSSRGKATEPQIWSIFLQIALGLEYLRSQRVHTGT